MSGLDLAYASARRAARAAAAASAAASLVEVEVEAWRCVVVVVAVCGVVGWRRRAVRMEDWGWESAASFGRAPAKGEAAAVMVE